MEDLQPLSSLGYCQDCIEFIGTMLKGGGIVRPTSLVSDQDAGCFWPPSPNCVLCKMISSSNGYSSTLWTTDRAKRHPPDTVIVEPMFGTEGQKRVVSAFSATSSAGPSFNFSIWSKNGEVLIPATAKSGKDAESNGNQSFLPISTIPPLDIDYGKPHYDMMRVWLQTCRDHHEVCKKDAASVVNENKQTILPTRLIDISRIEEGIVTLVDTKGARGNYCALSYCWGRDTDKHIKTTRATLSDHQAGIRFERLPQVFKDAIQVTHEIGLRYLWADSLCIIQGDDNDWKAEAGNMSEVYRNADLVIAAAGASNPSQGCFVSRTLAPFPETQVSHIPLINNPKSFKSIWIQQLMSWTDPATGPLQKRGWTLQETYLARRSVSFMPSGMFWQCQELKTNERTFGYPILHGDSWVSLLAAFSERQLTKKEDRLFAIQGLVNEVKADFGHYQKGVFTKYIAAQILWSIRKTFDESEEANRVEIWDGAPSWSWAHKSSRKWFWFEEDGIHDSLQANKSPVELTLTDDDVLRFTGYSASCQVADCVDNDNRTDNYEDAVLAVISWKSRNLYTMTQLGGATG